MLNVCRRLVKRRFLVGRLNISDRCVVKLDENYVVRRGKQTKKKTGNGTKA